MVACHFYHLTTSPLERALPKLLEKSYSGGYRAVVLFDSNEQVERFNTLLWTYDPNSFLPHGSAEEEGAHPILLTHKLQEKASGEKDILFVTNGASVEGAEGYIRIIDMCLKGRLHAQLVLDRNFVDGREHPAHGRRNLHQMSHAARFEHPGAQVR